MGGGIGPSADASDAVPPLSVPLPVSVPVPLPVSTPVVVSPGPVEGSIIGGGIGPVSEPSALIDIAVPAVVVLWPEVGPIIGGTSVEFVLALPVASLDPSSPHATPDNVKSNAPTAGRTSAGPLGGGVGRIFLEVMQPV